jgi:hypothetical protein
MEFKPQIGIMKQVAVIDPALGRDSGQRIVLINPIIIDMRGTQCSEAGCLSFPGFVEQITRSMSVTVDARNLAGGAVHMQSEGLIARALQHEIDNLNGTLFIRRMSSLRQIYVCCSAVPVLISARPFLDGIKLLPQDLGLVIERLHLHFRIRFLVCRLISIGRSTAAKSHPPRQAEEPIPPSPPTATKSMIQGTAASKETHSLAAPRGGIEDRRYSIFPVCKCWSHHSNLARHSAHI